MIDATSVFFTPGMPGDLLLDALARPTSNKATMVNELNISLANDGHTNSINHYLATSSDDQLVITNDY